MGSVCVMILVNNRIVEDVDTKKVYRDEGICAITFKDSTKSPNRKNLTLMGVYVPPEQIKFCKISTPGSKWDIMQNLCKCLDTHSSNDIITTGDFNAYTYSNKISIDNHEIDDLVHEDSGYPPGDTIFQRESTHRRTNNMVN